MLINFFLVLRREGVNWPPKLYATYSRASFGQKKNRFRQQPIVTFGLFFGTHTHINDDFCVNYSSGSAAYVCLKELWGIFVNSCLVTQSLVCWRFSRTNYFKSQWVFKTPSLMIVERGLQFGSILIFFPHCHHFKKKKMLSLVELQLARKLFSNGSCIRVARQA